MLGCIRGVAHLIAPVVTAGCMALPASAARAADVASIAIPVQSMHGCLPVIAADTVGFSSRGLATNAAGTAVVLHPVSGSAGLDADGPLGTLVAAETKRGPVGIARLAALAADDGGFAVSWPDLEATGDFRSDDRITVTGQQGPLGLSVMAEKAFGAGYARRLDMTMVQAPHIAATINCT